jgi:hypothetical protein
MIINKCARFSHSQSGKTQKIFLLPTETLNSRTHADLFLTDTTIISSLRFFVSPGISAAHDSLLIAKDSGEFLRIFNA